MTTIKPALWVVVCVTLGVSGAERTLAATVTLSVPKLEGVVGKEVEIPIVVKGGKGMSALQVRLTYDPAVIEVVKDEADPDKAITKGKILPRNAIFKVYTTSIPVHQGEPVPVRAGGLPIVFVGGTNKAKRELHAIEEDGTLATIRFRVIGKASEKSPLGLEKAEAFQSNDMDMIVKIEPGELTVVSGLPWLWIAIGGGVLVLVLLIALSRRKSASKPETDSRTPSSTSASPPQATFQCRCSRCRTSMTLPVLMAGKTIQCSACGASQTAMPD